jgi:hypothetical protein
VSLHPLSHVNRRCISAIDALCSILIPIEKGQLALTWQPPSRTAWYQERGTEKELQPRWIDWMVDQGRLSELTGHELVLECQKRFNRYQDRSEKEVETRMIKDLLVMQSELREEYRRFVIITDSSGTSNTSREVAASTSVSKADIKDGVSEQRSKDRMSWLTLPLKTSLSSRMSRTLHLGMIIVLLRNS